MHFVVNMIIRLACKYVFRLERISRNISDFASLIEELARLDISFVSIVLTKEHWKEICG